MKKRRMKEAAEDESSRKGNILRGSKILNEDGYVYKKLCSQRETHVIKVWIWGRVGLIELCQITWPSHVFTREHKKKKLGVNFMYKDQCLNGQATLKLSL